MMTRQATGKGKSKGNGNGNPAVVTYTSRFKSTSSSLSPSLVDPSLAPPLAGSSSSTVSSRIVVTPPPPYIPQRILHPAPNARITPTTVRAKGKGKATVEAKGAAKGKERWTPPPSDSDRESDIDNEVDDLVVNSRLAIFRLLDPREDERVEPASGKRKRDEEDKEVKKPPRMSELPWGVKLGDACFVRDGNSREYVNGYLKEFHPSPTGDWYEVVDQLSFKARRVRRAHLIFKTDKRAFATCTRREFTIERDPFFCDATTRETTPPPDPDALSLADRLVFARPHLQRIISEDYPPAQNRINLFYFRKQKQLDGMFERGNMPEEEVFQVVYPELERWARRAERWEGLPGHEDRHSEPPRPTGSERYELLHPRDRVLYVQSVLAPEALIHLSIPDNDFTGTPEEIYTAAVRQLRREGNNERSKLEDCAIDLNETRRFLRKELRMDEEHPSEYAKIVKQESEYNRKLEKTHTLTSGGRTVEKPKYKE